MIVLLKQLSLPTVTNTEIKFRQMKTNIRLCVSLFLLFFVVSSNAQMKVFNIPFDVTFEAGFSNQFRNGKSASNLNIHGVRLASIVELTLPLDIKLQTGAIYTSSNSTKTQGFYQSYIYSQSFGHAINVPLHVGYELPLFGQFKAFGFAGPSLGIGLSEYRLIYANMAENAIDLINESDLLINYTSGKSELYKDGELRRLNLMLGAGGGIRWKNYYIKSGYDFGLNNLNPKDSRKIVQSGWYLMGGYQFKF